MKYNILSLGILFLLAATMGACIDDQGNYDYRAESEIMPAVISGLESEYTFQLGSTHELTANVEGVEGVENLRYMWYVYGELKKKRDTLGYGKKLNFKVDWESGNYFLWFEVRDTVRDVCVDYKMGVTVESFLSTAWLVLESTGGMTDVDVVTADGSLKENLLSSGGQARLKGKPVKMAYTYKHEQEEEKGDGKVEVVTKKAFYLLSEKEIKVYNAENMELLKTAEDCFYEVPAGIAPMDCNMDSDAQLINDGKYYYLSGNSANVGKFGYAKLGPDGTTDYDLYGGILPASQAAMVWDKRSCSFLYIYAYNAQLGYFNEQVDGKEDFGSVTNMGAELKYLLYRSQVYDINVYAYITMGYGIMEKQGEYYIADIAFNNKSDYPLKGWYKFPADCKIIHSEVLGAHQTTASIFFASDDELWIHDVRNVADVSLRERKLFTFTGEKIACIRHIKIARGDFDCLTVLTNTGGNWKLYTFPFIGGGNEFDTTVPAEDVLIGKGEGEANSFLRMYQGGAY